MTRVASYAVAAAPGLPAAVFALPSAGERSLWAWPDIGLQLVSVARRKKQFFFEKKNQKTFAYFSVLHLNSLTIARKGAVRRHEVEARRIATSISNAAIRARLALAASPFVGYGFLDDRFFSAMRVEPAGIVRMAC